MADLSIQTMVRAGLADSFAAAAAGGDTFSNTGALKGRVFLEARNTHSAASRTLTFVTTKTIDDELDLAVDDPTVTLAAGARKQIGPFPASIYNSAAGKVSVTYSDAGANIEVRAVKFVPATS